MQTRGLGGQQQTISVVISNIVSLDLFRTPRWACLSDAPQGLLQRVTGELDDVQRQLTLATAAMTAVTFQLEELAKGLQLELANLPESAGKHNAAAMIARARNELECIRQALPGRAEAEP